MKLDDRKVVELNLNDILPNRFQPRITFSEDAINDLAESIKEHGVIQPIVVRKINDKYEIIAGERRFKASGLAGKKTIPAIVTDLNDKESAEIALIENVQREDLTPIEEAVSYKKILDMGYLTQEELSSKLGKQQSTISNKLRLLNLDEEVQEALLEKKISERHARSLLRLSEKDQRMMLNRIITERLTVRKADAEIEKLLNQEKNNDTTTEVEILDLDEMDNKGEKNMNEEMNNNFNIPTSPIIEDSNTTVGPAENFVTPTVESAPTMMGSFNIPNAPIVEDVAPTEPVMNPGFMDVDKIANTATDINVEKPTADLDSLLKPTPAPVEPAPATVDASIFGFTPAEPEPLNNTIPTSTEDQDSDLLKPGKFFDLSGLGVTNPVEQTSEPAVPEVKETISEPTSEPITSNTPATEENKSSMFGINLEPKNPDFVSNVEEKEANMDFDIPKPEPAVNNFNFDSFFTPTPAPSPAENVVEETVPVTPVEVVNQNVQNTGNTNQNSDNVIGTQNSEITQNTNIPTVESTPISAPEQNSVAQPSYTVPSADELDSFLSNLDSTTPLSNVAAEMNSTSDSSIVVPSSALETGAPVQNIQEQMGKVVAIIQEAKAKIAALGIKAEIDEFDFDDMYQAIIKIDK